MIAVMCAVLGVTWPAVSSAHVVADWNRLVLKLEPPQRFMSLTRSVALVHVAMHDAINSIPGSRRYATYLPPVSASPGASPEAAAIAAAHWVTLQYTQTFHPENTGLLEQIETLYATSLASIPDGSAKTAGIEVGEAAGAQLWTVRANDGWDNPDQVSYHFPAPAPGVWRQHAPWPSTILPPFYWWNRVTPWTMTHASQFLPPPPPELTSKVFLEDLAETRAYGASQSAVRTADQTFAARWWGACEESNPGGVILIARQLLIDYDVELYDSVRIFALLGLTLADAVISNIDSKNTWNFWRPITAIRESGDEGWTPFLVTPPNQEYPAGHPMISGSGLYLLAKFFPGRLRQPLHATSPSCGPRIFLSLSDAVEDVIGARVWGGMHFRNSGEVGAGVGKKLAHWVYPRYLRPLEDAQ